jgi:hypothetical protein
MTMRSFAITMLTSAGLVAPFFVLQWINRRAFDEDFPVALFTFMALNALLVVLASMPAFGRFQSEGTLKRLRFGHWAGVALSVVLAIVYVNVVIDQLPCFLGVPNCD